MFGLGRSRPVLTYSSFLSDNFSNKTVRDGIFGLGMAPKEILSRLFNPFNLKMLDLYPETQLWSPLICAEKPLHVGVDVWDYVKAYTFNTFNNILLLPLLLLLKLILSPLLPLLLSTIIYQFSYFINSSVYFSIIISP